MRLKQKHKGVSLVELILSIAVLSILSVYVIQMFITSQNLNGEAEALDRSVLISENLFEMVEKDQSLETVYNSPLFKYANPVDDGDLVTVELYFDSKWKPVESSVTHVYKLSFTVEEIQALEYSVVDYGIIIQREENSEVEQIYEIEMQKYY